MKLIDRINSAENWSSLKTNVGNAAHLPQAIIDLLSEDESVVDSAYWKIDNYVVLQSDLSESARYLPKYLEEVLLEAKYKSSVLELLFQIGNGGSEDKELEEDCYQQVINVLNRVLIHKNISGTKWEKTIMEDINDLKELYQDRT